MKNLILILVLLFSVNIFGQNSTKEIDTTFIEGNQKTIRYTDGSQSISLIKSNANSVNAATYKKVYNTPQEEIAQLKQYIKSLEIKVKLVKIDEVENNKAKESGWYNEMNKFISESKARVTVLETKISNKK